MEGKNNVHLITHFTRNMELIARPICCCPKLCVACCIAFNGLHFDNSTTRWTDEETELLSTLSQYTT